MTNDETVPEKKVKRNRQNWIYSTWAAEEMERRGELPTHFRDMVIDPKSKQLVRIYDKPGRNDKCPCGSEKKFKRCCGLKEYE